MREMILQALKTKLLGEMNGHIANIEVMMTNPVGVGDHPTIIDTIDKELKDSLFLNIYDGERLIRTLKKKTTKESGFYALNATQTGADGQLEYGVSYGSGSALPDAPLRTKQTNKLPI